MNPAPTPPVPIAKGPITAKRKNPSIAKKKPNKAIPIFLPNPISFAIFNQTHSRLIKISAILLFHFPKHIAGQDYQQDAKPEHYP